MNQYIIPLSIFAIFILFNIYIRVRTFGLYRQLVERRIQFRFKDIFSKSKWNLVINQYPNDVQLLNTFRRHMLTTGIIFILVIVVVLVLLSVIRSV